MIKSPYTTTLKIEELKDHIETALYLTLKRRVELDQDITLWEVKMFCTGVDAAVLSVLTEYDQKNAMEIASKISEYTKELTQKILRDNKHTPI